MFKEEVYNQISQQFAVSIGVASSMKTIDIVPKKGGTLSKEDISLVEKQFKEYRTQIQLHGIINRAIRIGRYKELMRIVLRDKTPKRSELTRYRTAWRHLTMPSTANESKPVERKEAELWR